jgi:hypothetical protein
VFAHPEFGGGVNKFERAGTCYMNYSVDPPEKSITGLEAFACTPSGNDQNCTLDTPGSYTANFIFAATPGTLLGAASNANTSAPSGGQYSGIPRPTPSCTPAQSSPRVDVPQQVIPFPITVIGPEDPQNPDDKSQTHAPATPTLNSNGQCVVGTAHTLSIVSSDPDNDNLKYAIDWNADGIVDQYIPGSGFIASGSTQTANRTYAIAGSKTVKVLAQDSNGNSSNWATVTFNCAGSTTAGLNDNDEGGSDETAGDGTAQLLPDLDLRVIPSLVRSGNTTKVNWSSTNVKSCTVTGQNGDSWTGLQSILGGNISKPITAQTTYTLSCIDLEGDTQTKQATVRILPTFQEI